MSSAAEIVPLPLGLFFMSSHEAARDSEPVVRAPVVVCAYLVKDQGTTILFDTGLAGDQSAVDRFRPRILDLVEQLGAHGVSRDDIDVVVNCHLHADHAGGNHLFPRTPILAQADELGAARSDDYTVRAACVDFPGATFRALSGVHDISERVRVLPTPGHSPGHQSLLVRDTADGAVLLAGQALDSASQFASAVLARQLGSDIDGAAAPQWMEACRSVDLALFAHDLAQWRPRGASFVGTVEVAAFEAGRPTAGTS